jgi:hypothetical protein
MLAAIGMPLTITSRNDVTTRESGRAQRLAFLVPMLFILIGFSTALVCILYDPDRKSAASKAASDSSGPMMGFMHRLTDQKPPTPSCSPYFILLPAHFGLRLVYFLFLNPLIAFTVQILLAVLSTVLVLSQKFARPGNQKELCGLQDEGENVWGFGQTLSVAMLLLPVLSACHTYLEGRQEIREG